MLKKINMLLGFTFRPPLSPLSSGEKVALKDRIDIHYGSILRRINNELNIANSDLDELIDIQDISPLSYNDKDLKVLIKHTKKYINLYNDQINQVNGWIDDIKDVLKEGISKPEYFNLKDINFKKYKKLDIDNIRKKYEAYL